MVKNYLGRERARNTLASNKAATRQDTWQQSNGWAKTVMQTRLDTRQSSCEGWAGAIMQKPLGIQKCYGLTYQSTWHVELLVCNKTTQNSTVLQTNRPSDWPIDKEFCLREKKWIWRWIFQEEERGLLSQELVTRFKTFLFLMIISTVGVLSEKG